MSTNADCKPERLELTANETMLPGGILLAIRKVREFVGERRAVKVDMVFPRLIPNYDPVLS